MYCSGTVHTRNVGILQNLGVMISVYILIISTTVFSTPVNSNLLSLCNMAEYGSSKEFRLDCRNRNLNAIPRNVYGQGVVQLDLSGNHFTVSNVITLYMIPLNVYVLCIISLLLEVNDCVRACVCVCVCVLSMG